MKFQPSIQDICLQVIEITDRFLKESEQHNISGIVDLVANRKKLLLDLKRTNANKNHFKRFPVEIREFVHRIREQDKILEKMVEKLKQEIISNIGNIKRNRSAIRRYRCKREKPSRFIDKKS
jgi:hypothetical protein